VTSYPRRSVGLVVTTNEPGAAQLVQQLPARAEQWGYDSLWVTDHTVGVRAMGGVYCDYWLDALTALTWIAATTSRVRLGTGVMVIPHRNPVLASKMITTIDVLSEGRVDLGVGTGWSRVEYRALGVESLFAQRGPVTDEAIEVMHAHPNANATSIFTTSGKAAREFARHASASMVGVNIGVAAPMAYFPFGGAKDSFFGDLKVHGRDAYEFYTDKKVVISRWF